MCLPPSDSPSLLPPSSFSYRWASDTIGGTPQSRSHGSPTLASTPAAQPKRAQAGPSKGTYSFVSLGCPKNLVDSERMLGLLQLEGYQLVPEPAGADFVVVNTCGFIERARAESYATIEEMLDLKRKGDIRGVIVSGC